MADLDFKHNVQQIPTGEQAPAPLKRQVAAQVTPIPGDIQGAVSRYAEATNWMSTIGSKVAASASTAIATKLGGELGKNPKGDLGIPLTEFDAQMQKSYQTQAHATLGLQASKLISDSNLEIANAPRVTPELIHATNKNVSIGLQNIFKNAPQEIRPQLEFQYGNMQIGQVSDLTERMIHEQKEDRKNNTALASQKNAEDAYSLGLKGNDAAALAAVQATKAANDADVQSRLITPERAKAQTDAARKSYLAGRTIHGYEKARAEGKGEQYLKDLADNKPKDISDADYLPVIDQTTTYIDHQNALRSQDEQLRIAKFNTSLAKDVSGISVGQLADLQENVSPLQFEKAQLAYIKELKKYQTDQAQMNAISANWDDPEKFARIPDKAVNQSFDLFVDKYVQQREAQGSPVSHDEAEVQVAASAGGKVPNFVEGLKNKINSSNPVMMDSAARQIDELNSMNAGHALIGLSDHDKSIFTQYKALRDSLPPEEAAKIAIQNANQDPDTQDMNKQKWASYIKQQTGGTVTPTDYALKQVGLKKDDFMNPGLANVYGNQILQKYATYFQMMNGDRQNALLLTKQHVKENFGKTGVNGGEFETLHPIEKILGYPENSDVVPFIQNDVIAKLNSSFVPLKESFGKNESNIYWDVVPKERENKALLFGHKYEPIQVKRYSRENGKVKTDLYDVVLIGNSFNWDIALSTPSGIRPLIQVAPYLGIHTYTPNKNAIDSQYKNHNLK